MSRRTFLRLAAAAAGVGVGKALMPSVLGLKINHYSPEWGTWFDGEKKLSFGEAAQIARHFDGIYDRLPPLARQVQEGDAEAWTEEIVPFYELNGIVPRVRFPKKDFFRRFTGLDFFFGYGQSDCVTHVWLNERFSREVSFWSWEYAQFLLSLIHENGHEQQGLLFCSDAFRQEEIEGSVQVATIEVAASMAREGARPMFYATVMGLREMAFLSAWKEAIKGERPQEIETLAQQIYHNPWEMALFRFRQDVVSGLSSAPFSFSAYGQWPLGKIIQSLESPGQVATGMAFPRTVPAQESYAPSDYDPAVSSPEDFDDSWGRVYASFTAEFPLNDLAYLLDHKEELVGAI